MTDPKPLTHGKVSTYRHHHCRCEACVSARLEYDRNYWRKRGRQPKGNLCEKDGVTYPTQEALGAAYGVTGSTVQKYLAVHGDLSRLGESRAHGRGGPKKPVKIGPREWPSKAALAAYIGAPLHSVRNWLRRGDMKRLLAAIIAADDAARAEAEAQGARAIAAAHRAAAEAQRVAA